MNSKPKLDKGSSLITSKFHNYFLTLWRIKSPVSRGI